MMFFVTSTSLGQAILIKRNEISPYDGILAPVNYIKDLEKKAELSDFYKSKLNENTNCLPELPLIELPDSKYFWIGTIVGGTVVIIIIKGLLIFAQVH